MKNIKTILEKTFESIIEEEDYLFFFNDCIIEKDLYVNPVTMSNPYGKLSSSENISDLVNQFYNDEIFGNIETAYEYIINGLYYREDVNIIPASPDSYNNAYQYNDIIKLIKQRDNYPKDNKRKKILLQASYNRNVPSIIQELKESFQQNSLSSVFKRGKNWHLSFMIPSNWYDEEHIQMTSVTNKKIIINESEYIISLDYIIIHIQRPWLNENIFTLPLSHTIYKKGEISNGIKENIKGVFPYIPNNMIAIRNLRIVGNDIYENKSYQIIAIKRKIVPYFPFM